MPILERSWLGHPAATTVYGPRLLYGRSSKSHGAMSSNEVSAVEFSRREVTGREIWLMAATGRRTRRTNIVPGRRPYDLGRRTRRWLWKMSRECLTVLPREKINL